VKIWSFLGETLPLAAFFIANFFYGLLVAGGASVLMGVVVLVVIWVQNGRVSPFVIFSLFVAILMTTAAVWLQDDLFIKLEATLFNAAFSLVLLGGVALGRNTMKDFFAAQFNLTDDTWRALTLRWGFFFACLALANEFVWRSLSVDGWVLFKVFVVPPITLIFALSQLPMTRRGTVDV
jgi:intracellular septation protein